MIRLYHGSNVAIDDFLLNNLDTELYLRGSSEQLPLSEKGAGLRKTIN